MCRRRGNPPTGEATWIERKRRRPSRPSTRSLRRLGGGGGAILRLDGRPDAASAQADEGSRREVQVAKNRLAQIALKGTDVASIGPLLKGPTLIAYSADPVAAAKAAVAFAKDHDKFVVLGGAMGKTALDLEGVQALATLPSLDELRAKLLGLITAPGDQARSARQRAGRQGRARHLGLRLERRSLIRLFTTQKFEPYREHRTWLIWKRSSRTSRA